MKTAREAMAEAIRKAEAGQRDEARLWLDIARELREGAAEAPAAMPEHLGPIRPYLRDPDAEDPAPQVEVVWFGNTPPGGDVVTFDASTIEGEQRSVTVSVPRERREQQVQRDATTETTPIYEGAGDDLGATVVISVPVARPDDLPGPPWECAYCSVEIVWENGRGWVHDIEGRPAACEPVNP